MTRRVMVVTGGIPGSRRVEDMNEESLQEIFRANVFSMYYCSRVHAAVVDVAGGR